MTHSLANKTIGIIGAGVMGRTLIKGMLDANIVDAAHIRAAVHTKTSAQRVAAEFGIATAATGYNPEWIGETDVFLVCTKPYRVEEVLRPLREQAKKDALVVSVAAGLNLAKMESWLPDVAVIRAMPNTPCRIGSGVTVISPGKLVHDHHLAMAHAIFSAVGRCLQLDEHHMDAVTAVSGSGPAYAYLIMEALADGAVRVGLPRDVAFQLVAQTMAGSAQMLLDSGKHPAMLKDEVTTPAGCTISALLTMEDGKIRSTLARAVEEATRTAAGLG